ncbi:hypothetical protein [Nonomuraea lactucae]|uniref:hypothetical protein n=1 Tax=Nonomuraea lactucae TaxID=2249762 RepID=UPI000DE4BD37|nr:hypothetical protein [Nonomuraea lactucae]
MDQTRKMWASAAVVGVIIVGGVSVAAAASAGRLDQAARQTGAVVEKSSPSSKPSGGSSVQTGRIPDQLTQLTSSPEPRPTDGAVVSKEINPDPDKVLDYWTGERLQDAEPMPMPEVEPGQITVGE